MRPPEPDAQDPVATPSMTEAVTAPEGGSLLGGEVAWLAGILWQRNEHVQVRVTTKARAPAGYRIVEQFAIVPNMRHPRLLLPLESRRAAAAALGRFTNAVSVSRRLAKQVAAAGLRVGVAQPLLRHRLQVLAPAGLAGPGEAFTVRDYLQRVLDSPGLTTGVALGPPRPNRKPVLQVLDRDGRAVGYAKIGWNDLTRRLVRSEADFLVEVAPGRLATVEVPRLLHAGAWHDLEITVVSPLPQRALRGPGTSASPSVRAVREVAALGRQARMPVHSTRWWQRVRERATTSLSQRNESTLAEALNALERAASATSLDFAAWHGDWTPWNTARAGTRVLLWDWERTSSQAPLGFDVLHFHFSTAFLFEGSGVDEAVAAAGRRSEPVLAELGIEVAARPLLLSLYLFEIYLRYSEDHLLVPGGRLERLCDRILAILGAAP